jgi:hypothetical protein
LGDQAVLWLSTRDADGDDFIDLFHFPKDDTIDNTMYAFFKESVPNIRALLDELADLGRLGQVAQAK